MTTLEAERKTPAAARVAELVEEISHLLPAQGPLHAFVHHNTLHAFEDQPFEEAVVDAAGLFGTEPFQTEAAFARHLDNGRIRRVDLVAVTAPEVADQRTPIVPGGPGRLAFRVTRLEHLFEIPRGTALDWHIHETDLLRDWHPRTDKARRLALEAQATTTFGDDPPDLRRRRTLTRLWDSLERAEPATPLRRPRAAHHRRRDQVLATTGYDTDSLAQPLLIRLAAAFLDQGISYWPMPSREKGLLDAFRDLYTRFGGPVDSWCRGLADWLAEGTRLGWSAAETIVQALQRLGHAPEEWEDVLRETLLATRGWAGMVRQFELRPDRAPVESRPARLIDFAAIAMTLDLFAAEHKLRTRTPFRDFDTLTRHVATMDDGREAAHRELVYEAFVVAQLLELDLATLDRPEHAAAFLGEVAAFDELERRRLLHRAYERCYRNHVLDSLVAHDRLPRPRLPEARFQAVFCIDDRECSTRRLLEESFPQVRTFGYAGFFGVAMAYQGLGEARARPLCPVQIEPKHLVRERALRPEEEHEWLRRRRRRGLANHATAVGSRTLTRGGVLTALLGIVSVVPLILRCLAPRFAERLLAPFAHPTDDRPPTRLAILRRDDGVDEFGRAQGYTHEEMADIVETVLRTMALDPAACPILAIVGHGSSSLNNPHEAAYDCGATGGGRGGPNARAFASMANRPEVRRLLRERGLDVPDHVWVLGGYHNTCNDSMEWYDTDLIPEELLEAFEETRHALDRACRLDAHERCRRFDSASTDLPESEALTHAEARAVDLGQPRPEYGHSTNAMALIGRRDRYRGLYLDRRAFLVSYDPKADPDGARLEKLLAAVVPVGAGINLEYYFSAIDPTGYGCGTKLPHNIVGLIGVMDGHASDLRTGLTWQMVEIHEPVRLLAVVEVERAVLERIMAAQPTITSFVARGWIQLVRQDPDSEALELVTADGFVAYEPEAPGIAVVEHSIDHYRGRRGALPCAHVRAAFGEPRVQEAPRAGGRA